MGYPNRINSAWYARTYRNKNLVCGPPSFGRALARGPKEGKRALFHLPVFFLRIPAAALSPEPTHTIRAAPWVRSPAEGVIPHLVPKQRKVRHAMTRLLLTLQYDGTRYHGWQVQRNARTVQEVLQDAVERITGVRSGITGCSRTDAGVHALMFCCALDTGSPLRGGEDGPGSQRLPAFRYSRDKLPGGGTGLPSSLYGGGETVSVPDLERSGPESLLCRVRPASCGPSG